MQRAYLDNAATTPLHPQVKQTIAEAMDFYANPSSLHHLGAEVEKLLGRARAQVAGLLHVSPAGIIFTSGGTEANNLAIKGVLARSRRRGRILTSAIEHPSVLEVFRRLELEGWDVRRIPVDSRGRIMLDALEAALKEPAALVSIMAVNNEIGAVQPLDEAVTLIESRPQALIHVDGVQAPGKINLMPRNWEWIWYPSAPIRSTAPGRGLSPAAGTATAPAGRGGQEEGCVPGPRMSWASWALAAA